MYGRYDARLRRRSRRACALMGNIARHDNHETYMSVVLRLAALQAAIGDMDGSNSSSLQFVGSAVSAFNQGVNLRSHTST